MNQNFEQEVKRTEAWFGSERFNEITRLYSPTQVVEQRGTIKNDYSIAKNAAAEFSTMLRDLFNNKKSITTFGPYSPGQAVMMKKNGIPGIYLGGWATSAKGSETEDPGSDLASYPLSRVPEEAAAIVRSLLAADKNQLFARARMTEAERQSTPVHDYRPFIVADADTGHGGDAHVRNLIRRFVEAGVTGYHIEDQKPGTKKCGHQGGKVLVGTDEQIKRLNTARFQLDLMEVEGIIVARTDAEAATLLESISDERDHAFVLGVTNLETPSFKDCYLYALKTCNEAGIKDINTHLAYKISDKRYDLCKNFFATTGLDKFLATQIEALKTNSTLRSETVIPEITAELAKIWEKESGLKTYGQAIADAITQFSKEGRDFKTTAEEFLAFSLRASFQEMRDKALELGVDIEWSADPARTPDGYYQLKGGLECAVARSLAVAPFCDIIWMETKTANIKDASEFADAIHAVYPEKMLAYNLSPSFNWDTTGMTDDEMKTFPVELGKRGFVFNFITYGGHQIDGLAAEEFSNALLNEGMLALAKLQRRLRLIESPYAKPQSHVGGNRYDAALTASSGRSATTVAMGKGSTQFQHSIQTEVPLSVLNGWLSSWLKKHNINDSLHTKLRPMTALSSLLELSVLNETNEKVANIIFANVKDRQGNQILSIRNQGTLKTEYRQKRLMTLMQSFLAHRYKSMSFHYLSPNDDNHRAVAGMKKLGLFSEVKDEVGDIIVANVQRKFISDLLEVDNKLAEIITRN